MVLNYIVSIVYELGYVWCTFQFNISGNIPGTNSVPNIPYTIKRSQVTHTLINTHTNTMK